MRFLAFARNDITVILKGNTLKNLSPSEPIVRSLTFEMTSDVILTTAREEESLFNERVHRDSSHSTIGLGSERKMKPNCHTTVTETSTLCIYPVMRKSDFCCRKIMGIK